MAFTTARTRLEGMALDPKGEILARMRALTVAAAVVQAVDKAQSGTLKKRAT